MDALTDLCLRVLVSTLWNFFGLGLVCVFAGLYGAGSGWPVVLTTPLFLVWFGSWVVSVRGGVRLWRDARASSTSAR